MGIVAVYEVDRPEVPLINISTRGQVLTGNDVMIAGFVVQGTTLVLAFLVVMVNVLTDVVHAALDPRVSSG